MANKNHLVEPYNKDINELNERKIKIMIIINIIDRSDNYNTKNDKIVMIIKILAPPKIPAKAYTKCLIAIIGLWPV